MNIVQQIINGDPSELKQLLERHNEREKICQRCPLSKSSDYSVITSKCSSCMKADNIPDEVPAELVGSIIRYHIKYGR